MSLATKNPRRWAVACAAAVLLAGSLVSCSSATSGADRSPGGGVGDVLTVAHSIAPQTLDPAKTVQNNAWYQMLAYQPLIVRRSDGTLLPGLAASWQYRDGGNTTFELTLRRDVTFSDGSKLTAKNVVDHFTYVQKAGGQFAPLFAGDTFTAEGPRTVVIETPKPNPDLPILLTQDYVVGGIVSPTGLKHKAKLGTRTSGAGPYRLDPSATVAGDHYTYVRNSHYYDKKSVHWKKVVIRVITDPKATLNAMKTGQVDVAVGDPSTLSVARKAGLGVDMTPLLWTGVTLADRDGTMAKPLADVRVRRALNHATDRKAIASALFPDNGEPTQQLTAPGGAGYDKALERTYPYDVARAKALLAEAGYPRGFELKIVTGRYGSMNLVAQALAQQWKKVGVTLKVTDHANANQYFSAAFAPKFPAFMTAFGHQPIWTEGPSLFLPTAMFNPFHTKDAKLQALYDDAAKARGDEKKRRDRVVKAYLVEQAWFVPVVATGLPYYAGRDVTGTSVSPKAPLASLYEVRPAA